MLVDMTTSEPISCRGDRQGGQGERRYCDWTRRCPVGDVGAKKAAAVDHGGWGAEVVEAVKPLFECMGKTIIHQGDAGAGQHTKMVNQILIAGNMVGVCESLLYGYKAGLDLETVLQSVGGGAAASWSLNNLGPRIIARNFEPGFFVEHFIKDMGIALQEAKRMGLACRAWPWPTSSIWRCERRARQKGDACTHAGFGDDQQREAITEICYNFSCSGANPPAKAHGFRLRARWKMDGGM